MNDSISREEVLRAIITAGEVESDSGYTHLYKVIENLPSTEPEIIRCEDCEWCEEHYDTDGNAPYWVCKNWDGGTDADGFCYEAERKIDEGYGLQTGGNR